MTEERSASDRLKARLTGAVALLLIGVIGWFWLLDSDNPAEPIAQESAIPPAPAIQPFTVAQPTAPADIKPVGSERDASVVEELPAYQEPPVVRQAAPKEPVAAKPQPVPATKPVNKPAVNYMPTSAADVKRVAPEAVAKPAPTPKVAVAPTKPAPTAPVAVSTPVKAAPQQLAEKLEMDVNNLPVAWVVQVGAMATQPAADKLKQDLIAKGFKAFTQPAKLANGSATIKVFVGPKLSREHADAQKKQIDAALKTNTMVVRFPSA